MLLAVDIGNTNITFGLFNPDRSPKIPKPLLTFRLNTFPLLSPKRTASLISRRLGRWKNRLSCAAIASVVPGVDPLFRGIFHKHLKVKQFWIDSKSALPIRNLYEKPRQVGADRIVNAVACYERLGGPAVIVDFGTATTFDCISGRGDYLGGLIVPGPQMASESLKAKTAKLPFVPIARPRRLIGRNTVESIRSGLYHGYVSLVDGIIERLKRELGRSAVVIATGGLARLVAGESRHIRMSSVHPDLTLEGIYLVWELNRE